MKTAFVVLMLIGLPLAAAAQSTAMVVSKAPIYVTRSPAPNLAPLRVAAVGTLLRVLGEQDDWVQVEFEDPRWGPRVGWVQKRHVTISDPLKPMDLSVRDAPAAIVPRPGNVVAEEELRGRPQTREGFWFNAGLGFGSLGCDACAGREDGLSGGLSLGGRITDRLLLGVGTTGWAKEMAGELFTVGTLDVRLRFYPVRTSGFFLTGGVGAGSISVGDESEIGLGVVLGVGWDIRVGRNVSLSPFYNGFAMRNSIADANVGQLGIGVTIH
jgi:hypothetical protein